jgi:hypothetical protein
VRLERGEVHVEGTNDDDVVIGDGGDCIMVSLDDARWLMLVALPTILANAAKVPSDPPARVDEAEAQMRLG